MGEQLELFERDEQVAESAVWRNRIDIRHGDSLSVLAELRENSIDSVVCDPPYALSFMSKDWDATHPDAKIWSECLRALKPGGHLVSFGGTRTWHRLACDIEDAGFEIRDNLAWLYGSGFPKSMDVSKAIDKAAGAEREVVSRGNPVKRMIPGADQNKTGSWIKDNGREFVPAITAPATDAAKQWNGWGTALKPAFEPIILARKPLTGTVAANVLEHGTGALNIDGCRVGFRSDSDKQTVQSATWYAAPNETYGKYAKQHSREIMDGADSTPDSGRWPANVLLDDTTAAALDGQTGAEYDDQGASRFFPVFDTPFKYQAKAPRKERPEANGVKHPTVKPLELMRWLVRLVTPPHGTVLDPFAGSGTTGEASYLEGFSAILIEREVGYLPLIEQRMSKYSQ